MKKIRLHKAIADTGIASRRKAEVLISKGKVSVNNVPVKQMGVLVDPTADIITIDGVPISEPPEKRVYILNKPTKVICTRSDPQKRKTVFELMPRDIREGLHTAGRLDFDAEGLIILTNDGDLTYHLTHPGSHVPKIYMVKMRKTLGSGDIRKLKKGVLIDGIRTLPAEVSQVQTGSGKEHWYRIVLREGRNNQLKRMAQAVGNTVQRIIRVKIGSIALPDRMKPGSYRRLKSHEVKTLKRRSKDLLN